MDGVSVYVSCSQGRAPNLRYRGGPEKRATKQHETISRFVFVRFRGSLLLSLRENTETVAGLSPVHQRTGDLLAGPLPEGASSKKDTPATCKLLRYSYIKVAAWGKDPITHK